MPLGIVVPCPLKDLTVDDFAEHLRVNLTGNFAIVRAAALHMMENQGKNHTRCASYHSQTQGKIERWHQTLKNRTLLKNYYLPGDLEAQIDTFVARYNHQRYHQSLKNLTPADVCFGRSQTILLKRERIKRKTIKHRRLQHAKAAA